MPPELIGTVEEGVDVWIFSPSTKIDKVVPSQVERTWYQWPSASSRKGLGWFGLVWFERYSILTLHTSLRVLTEYHNVKLTFLCITAAKILAFKEASHRIILV